MCRSLPQMLVAISFTITPWLIGVPCGSTMAGCSTHVGQRKEEAAQHQKQGEEMESGGKRRREREKVREGEREAASEAETAMKSG